TISGGTLNLTDTGNDSNVATLAQSNGTLGGAATLNVTGTFTWSGGTMSDAGTTAVAAGATVNQTGFVTAALGRTIDNLGTYDLQGNFNLNNSGSSTFHN